MEGWGQCDGWMDVASSVGTWREGDVGQLGANCDLAEQDRGMVERICQQGGISDE